MKQVQQIGLQNLEYKRKHNREEQNNAIILQQNRRCGMNSLIGHAKHGGQIREKPNEV